MRGAPDPGREVLTASLLLTYPQVVVIQQWSIFLNLGKQDPRHRSSSYAQFIPFNSISAYIIVVVNLLIRVPNLSRAPIQVLACRLYGKKKQILF